MEGPIESKIERILLDDLGVSPDLVHAGYLFSGAELDSFDRIRLVELLQERFEIQIDWSAVIPENFDSISAMVQLIRTIRMNRVDT